MSTQPLPILEPIVRRDFPEPIRAELQDRIIRAVERDPQRFLDQYVLEPRSFQGRFITSDLVKEIFPEYAASRETRNRYNVVVHNSAAALASAQYRSVLNAPNDHDRNVVTFVTGVPGAGKSTLVLEHGNVAPDQRLIYEGQLADATALSKIEMAVKAGFETRVHAVHANPLTALHQTINRVQQVGRGASIEAMASIQGTLYNAMRAIQTHFGDRVRLTIFDRSQPVTRILSGWQHVEILKSEGDYGQIKQRLFSELGKLAAAGLSEAAYNQARGLPPVPISDSLQRRVVDRSGESAQRSESGTPAGPVVPETIEVLTRNFKQTVTTLSPFDVDRTHAPYLMDAIYGRPYGRKYLEQLSDTVEAGSTHTEHFAYIGRLSLARDPQGELQFTFSPHGRIDRLALAVDRLVREDRAALQLSPKPQRSTNAPKRGKDAGRERSLGQDGGR